MEPSSSERKLVLGAILPHTQIFGGVKRYFELGNVLIQKGHQFIIFTPEGIRPSWFNFKGTVTSLDNLSDYALSALLVSETQYLPLLDQSKSVLKIFYAILERSSYVKKIFKYRDFIILANSTSLYNYMGGDKRSCLFKALGGIDTEKFSFRNKKDNREGGPFIVMAYGRFYKRKKGTMLVVKACERLYKKGYNIKLHLFDSPTDEYGKQQLKKFNCTLPYEFFIDYPVKDLAELYYQADVFVSAERNAGWSNTSAEAMACGVPVIATGSGTKDILTHKETGLLVWRHSWFIERAIKKMYGDPSLRTTLASNARKKIEGFSWRALAENLEDIIFSKIA